MKLVELNISMTSSTANQTCVFPREPCNILFDVILTNLIEIFCFYPIEQASGEFIAIHKRISSIGQLNAVFPCQQLRRAIRSTLDVNPNDIARGQRQPVVGLSNA